MQRLSDQATYPAAIAYYAVSALLVASLVLLTISVSFEDWKSPGFVLLSGVFQVYGFTLFFLFIFYTPVLITDVTDFRRYTVLGQPGPYYWLYEILLISSMLLFFILPTIGIRKARFGLIRGRCKLWLVGAIPLAIVVIAIVLLLRAGIHWFNSTVTTPLLITLLLAVAGYATHCRRIIELDFYVPGSKARRFKRAFYQELRNLGRELRALHSPELMLERVAAVMGCAAILKFADGDTVGTQDCGKKLIDFPIPELLAVRQIVLQTEPGIPESTRASMRAHGVGAIVPFFPQSGASCWLLFGERFGARLYSRNDLAALEKLLRKLAGCLLDSSTNRSRFLGAEKRIADLEERYRRLDARLMSQLSKLRAT